MNALVASLLLLLVNALASMYAAAAVQMQPAPADPGVYGYVLAPDGTPVSGGTVVAHSVFQSARTPIDSTGHFRFVPPRAGLHQVVVTVPGLVPYRLAVDVPASRTLRLPVIHLVEGAYYRVRLVSTAGEPILAPRLRRRVFDASGTPIFDEAGDATADAGANDGVITIGPMPRGAMTAAVDMPFFAQTRLPDVSFSDALKNMDSGTIAIQQPGAFLNVDLLDESGLPVPNHDVFIADPRPRSPLVFQPARTNQQGRATFDRLAAGRYRVSAAAIERCANVRLSTSRVVSVSGSGTSTMRLFVGGRATFRITSPLGPLRAALISAAPNVPSPPPPSPSASRPPAIGCTGATDRDGRVTLMNFPPGPAHIDVRLATSTYVHQVDVPTDGQEIRLAIPESFASVHVVSALDNEPVSSATVSWIGSGARVEATTTASGDALLEGVGAGGGILEVSAQKYKPAEEQLTEPPGLPYSIALAPLPPARVVRPRVITASGEPLSKAVVELVSANPGAVPRIAVTDAKGLVTFADVGSGSIQLIASADGFVTSAQRVAEDRTGEVVFTLSRGYRVIASVEPAAAAGPQLVRVMNDANASMESLLDDESARRLETPGRLSIGPLAAGVYVIELQGAGGRRQERIRLVDGDVHVTFR